MEGAHILEVTALGNPDIDAYTVQKLLEDWSHRYDSYGANQGAG